MIEKSMMINQILELSCFTAKQLDRLKSDECHDYTAHVLHEPRREKTGFLHMRKQRRRSASR